MGVQLVVVDRADGVDQRADDLRGAGGADHGRGAAHRVHVVHRVEHDEAADPAQHQPVVGQLHQVRVDAFPGDEPEPRADELQRGVRHRRVGEPDALPRVLPVGAHRDPHVGAGGVVQGAEPDPVQHRGDLQDLRRVQPGRAPQALVTVPDRHVEEFQLSPRSCQETGKPRRVDAAGGKSGIGGQGRVHVHGGRHAFDPAPRQGAAQPLQSGFASLGVHDQLCQEGVVERRHVRARLQVRVDPDARSGRPVRVGHGARVRPEVVPPVLGVETTLDGVP